MNIRPRCREWLPLCTQQLRLRNLQAIHGSNIEFNPNGTFSDRFNTPVLLYYTLHDHPLKEPFYQSEKLALQKHLNVKWAEIQCPEILKSNANCVCVKVWTCVKKSDCSEIIQNIESREEKHIKLRKKVDKEPFSTLAGEFVDHEKFNSPPDTLLFNWGVYFSGLIPLSQNVEIKCCENSLIFRMNDEYFVSPERISMESLRGQLALNYERHSASVPKCSISTFDEFNIYSPQVSRSSSPAAVDWQNDLLRMSKTRYVSLNCDRSAIRGSYDLDKLLRLQQLQRQRLQIQRETIEMTADIKRLSLRCITKEQLLRKPRTTSINSSNSASAPNTSQYHSMGRTLSLLLAEQQRVDPQQLLKAQKLQQQLESIKSKQRLLVNARDTLSHRITHLKQELKDSIESREQLQARLSEQKRKLHDENLVLQHLRIENAELHQRRTLVSQDVQRIMYSLCLELRDIYPIERDSNGIYTICGVPFPRMDGYLFDSPRAQSVLISENITPMALSASLGYVAHLIEMISVILNRPLRNPIIHEGSRTRIVDVVKNIPPFTSREFPLYSRSSIPTKSVKYAVGLLSQNVAQFHFDLTGACCDMRAIIDNLQKIFARFIEMEREIHVHKLHLPSSHFNITEMNSSNEVDSSTLHPDHYSRNHQEQTDSDHKVHLSGQMSTKSSKHDYCLSKSHSSVDMNHILPPHLHHNVPVLSLTTDKILPVSEISAHRMDMQNRSVLIIGNQQRNCRSVGSYTDSEEEVCHSTPIKCFSKSESNLTSLQSDDHHHV